MWAGVVSSALRDVMADIGAERVDGVGIIAWAAAVIAFDFAVTISISYAGDVLADVNVNALAAAMTVLEFVVSSP